MEAQENNKLMMLPFRFKGDNKIYTVFNNDDILELITMYKALKYENDILTKLENT